jgi:hypothetical protein
MLAKVSEVNGHHTIKLAQKLFILISFNFYCLHIIQYDGAVWFPFSEQLQTSRRTESLYCEEWCNEGCFCLGKYIYIQYFLGVIAFYITCTNKAR